MALDSQEVSPYVGELRKIYEDASYSAQAYFEAAKRADFWGRAIVSIPALLGAAAGVVVALGGAKEWGSVGAVAGVVAATASLLGSNQNSDSFKQSARAFTQIRHRAGTEIALAARKDSEGELGDVLRSIREEYGSVVAGSEPVPGRAFKKAQRRIGAGVLEYAEENRRVSGNVATDDASS